MGNVGQTPEPGHEREPARPPHVTRLATSSGLVGRDVERRLLMAGAFSPPALVVVEGEAGVGKTRLVAELLDDRAVTGRRILFGQCYQSHEPFPLAPVVEALRVLRDAPSWTLPLNPVVGALVPLLPELAEHLPPALPPLGDRGAERHRLARAVRELLCASGPTLLVLEDVHLSDTHTQDVLQYVMRHMPHQLSIVLTVRQEELADASPLGRLFTELCARGSLTELRLAPLDVAGVGELAGLLVTDEAIPAGFLEALHERTGGLPFAVETITRTLREERAAGGGGSGWSSRSLTEFDLPPALRRWLLEQPGRLAPDGQLVVQAAAVLGRPATEESLAAVAGLSRRRATNGLSVALARALLCEHGEGRYTVRHPLVAQAVDESLPTSRRREMHARAVHALRAAPGPPSLPQLAHHARRSGDAAQWWHYAEAAADQATAARNESAAAPLLLAVLSDPGLPSGDRVRMAVKLSRAAWAGVDHIETVAVLRRALAEPMPAEVHGELRLNLGLLLRNQGGAGHTAIDEIAGAVTELRHRPALVARAMASLAVPVAIDGGSLGEHLEWLRQATAAAHRVRDPVIVTAVLVNRACALMSSGDSEAWQVVDSLPTAEATPAQRLHLARACVNLAQSTNSLGHHRAAEEFLHRGKELLAEADAPYLTGMAESGRLMLDWAVGRWTGLRDRAVSASARLADQAAPAAEAQLVTGLLALAAGDVPEAVRALRAAVQVNPNGWVPVLAAARAALVRADGTADDTAEAYRMLDAIRRKGVWVWAVEVAPVVVEALVRDGRLGAAEEAVAEYATGIADRDSPAAICALVVCRAVLAQAGRRYGEAEQRYAEAEALYRALPRPYEAARALEARGACRFAAGRDGLDALKQALTEFDALGAGWDAARCRLTLRKHGVAVPHRRGPRGYGRQLSPREQQVAELAAAGMTNREIAAALYLSPRTVEQHMAGIMHKLNVSSRQAIAAAMTPHQ